MKIEKSESITINDMLRRICSAFYLSFGTEYSGPPYIREVFTDFLVVESTDLQPGEFYKVPYTVSEDGSVIIMSNDNWEVVELAFEPAGRVLTPETETPESTPETETESEPEVAESKKTRFVETATLPVKVSSRKITAIGLTCDTLNANQRIYPVAVVRDAVNKLQTHLHESNGQGRVILLGEVEHPTSKGKQPSLSEVAIKWTKVSLDESVAPALVRLEGEILPTTLGNDLIVLAEHGVPIGISQRAFGHSITEGKVEKVVRLDSITGYDAVLEPSDPNASVTQLVESLKRVDMTRDELRKLIEAQPNLFKGMNLDVDTIDEAVLPTLHTIISNAAGMDVTELLKELDNAKLKVEEKKMADEKLEEMGLNIQAPVKPIAEAIKEVKVASRFESYTRQPEYVKASHLMLENAAKRNSAIPNFMQPKNPVEAYAAEYLKAFDKKNALHLINEHGQWTQAQALNEAMQTSDISMPYTALRTIYAELLPMSVAISVFNAGQMANNPERIFFEEMSAESGLENSVAATAINAFVPAWTPAVVGGWANFPAASSVQYRMIVPGSVAFSGGFTEGTDYLVDYYNGRIYSLTGGFAAMANATTLEFDYVATRKGEMQPVERIKQTIAHRDITAMANRLSVAISDEATRFSASQLGYDATGKAIEAAAKYMAMQLDRHLFYFALGQLLTVPSNFVSYSKGNPVDSQTVGFTVRAGEARLKVRQRYFDADACKLIVNADLAELMSNSQLFENYRSRPDFALSGTAGHIGFWKGMPVYESTETPSGYAMVVHPDLMYYRTYSGVEIENMLPTYASSGDVTRLVDAKQYMLRQYDSMDVLRGTGGSVIVITA